MASHLSEMPNENWVNSRMPNRCGFILYLIWLWNWHSWWELRGGQCSGREIWTIYMYTLTHYSRQISRQYRWEMLAETLEAIYATQKQESRWNSAAMNDAALPKRSRLNHHWMVIRTDARSTISSVLLCFTIGFYISNINLRIRDTRGKKIRITPIEIAVTRTFRSILAGNNRKKKKINNNQK